jgi:hypothetical protein
MEERMRQARRTLALLAVSILLQAGTASLGQTQTQAQAQREFPTAVGTGVFSAFATVVGLPIKIATCAAMTAVGGVGYGLTLGHSDLVRQEFLSGLPLACGMKMNTTAPEVTPYLGGPQPDELVR